MTFSFIYYYSLNLLSLSSCCGRNKVIFECFTEKIPCDFFICDLRVHAQVSVPVIMELSKRKTKDYTWILKSTEEITLFKTFNVLIVTHNTLMFIINVNIYHCSIDDLIQSPVCFLILNMKLFCGYFPKSFSYVPMHIHVPRN